MILMVHGIMAHVDGEIVLIDPEEHAELFYKEILSRLNYDVKLKIFRDCTGVVDYLKKTSDIFLIICETNFDNGASGYQLKDEIDSDENLWIKAIPFVFTTDVISEKIVAEAYKHRIQGFFVKPGDLEELSKVLSIIIQYWLINSTPEKIRYYKEILKKL